MEKVISRDGTTIAYDRKGDGASVILVDGAVCSRSFGPMPDIGNLLSHHFTVFHYDRRGRGDSGDQADYSVDREIEDLEALIQVAGGSAYVFGISAGAILSLRGAASGLNIRKLALYEPPVDIDKTNPDPMVDASYHIQELVVSGRRSKAAAYFLTNMIGVPGEQVEQMQTTPIWSYFEAIAHTLAYDVVLVGDSSFLTRLPSITAPTLVISKKNNHTFMGQAAQSIADRLPHAEHRILEGPAHAVELPPEILVPVLEAFFRA